MNKLIKNGLIPSVFLLGSVAVHAITPGLYLGAGAGISGFDTPSNYYSERDTGFGGRVFAGYNFNQYLGLETNYASLGKKKYANSYFPITSGEYTLNALSFVGKVYLPLSDDSPLNIYGLVGGAEMFGKYKYDHSWFGRNITESGFVPTAGLGVSYELSQRFTAGLEFSGFGQKKANSNHYGIPRSALGTISLGYRF